MTQSLSRVVPDHFQARVHAWMLECFGEKIAADQVERSDRFIEEALELTQAIGYTAERAHALVDYVFGRAVGEPSQEVGGVMVTLAALCNVNDLDIQHSAQTELDRITQPEVVLKIRAKQAAKPTGSALPIAAPAPDPDTLSEAVGLLRRLLDYDEVDAACLPTDAHLNHQNECRAFLAAYDANTPEVSHD